MKYKKEKNNDILFHHNNSEDSLMEKLPAGIYFSRYVNSPFHAYPYFQPIEPKETLVKFKTGIIGDSLKKIGGFFDKSVVEKFKEMQIVHKMGLIYYGKPGTGKTCTAYLLMQELVEKYEAICLDCNKLDTIQMLIVTIKQIREVQNNPIVVFYDEVDAYIANEENRFLTFLDGNDSVDGLIFIGCTNYITDIPDRIINRKSRIKYNFEIKSLPLEVYKDYISSKVPSLNKKLMAELAYQCVERGLTIDQLKNVLIDVYIHGDTVKKAIEEVEKYISIDEKDDDF